MDSPAPAWLSDGPDGCILTVHIQPGARGAGVVGAHGDALKIRIDAPPIDGKANQALLALLAKQLELPKSRFSILSGESGRRKRVLVRGGSMACISAALQIAAE